MDEKGNQMGGGCNGIGLKFIFLAEEKENYHQHSDNLELVTIIECAIISSVQRFSNPSLVLSIATSSTGWTDWDTCKHWFTDIFVPEAEKHHVDKEKPIILTLDGHDSHEMRKIKQAAYKHYIIIIALPSKTTHKLQPLDVEVFSSIQRQWSTYCDEQLGQGVRITRYNFIQEYLATCFVITPTLVQKAFTNTRIYPLNTTLFHERDFAPSLASSSVATFPMPYPDEVPSSP
ncbi:hypothetical protein PAXRUDRAFT_796294, partial [Paxillus rubicundulus Ve08.2h10]